MYSKISAVLCLLFAMSISQLNCQVITEEYCYTPSWEYGLCVHYKQCGLIEKVNQRYGGAPPAQVLNFLRRSRCTPRSSTLSSELHMCCKPSDIHQPNRQESNGMQILNATKCGTIQGNRIAGGESARLSEFKFMALLRYDAPRNPFQCGGSLITNRYVLTAAHCINANDNLIGVRLGEHKIDSDVDCITLGRKKVCAPPTEDYGIDKVIVHPSFQGIQNDIALIKLDRDVDFKSHIEPICLPLTQQSSELNDDDALLIAGWGKTEHGDRSTVLLKAYVGLQNRNECKRALSSTSTPIDDRHVCAIGSGVTDTCRGDSGGPLFTARMLHNGNRYVQFGITSFGLKRCGSKSRTPGVYTSVVRFLPWIVEHID